MYGAFTLCGAPFQNASTRHRLGNSSERLPPLQAGPTTPPQHRRQAVPLWRFRLVPFRSPLLGESRLLFFPRGTEMFQFPRCPPPALCVQAGVTGHDPSRVSPFGYPRVIALGRQLPVAFRSHPRPSSASGGGPRATVTSSSCSSGVPRCPRVHGSRAPSKRNSDVRAPPGPGGATRARRPRGVGMCRRVD